MTYLRLLRGVKNLAVLVEWAVEAQTEAEGLAVIRDLVMFSELHRRDPIEKLIDVGLVGAVLKRGEIIVAVTADYVHNSKEIADGVADFRKAYPDAPAVFVVSGRVSAAARKTFEAAKVRVNENDQLP